MSYGRLRRVAIGLPFLAAWLSTTVHAEENRGELLIYCGITMLQPITEIARIPEKEQNVGITISQGASEDFDQSLRKSGLGDRHYRQRVCSL